MFSWFQVVFTLSSQLSTSVPRFITPETCRSVTAFIQSVSSCNNAQSEIATATSNTRCIWQKTMECMGHLLLCPERLKPSCAKLAGYYLA